MGTLTWGSSKTIRELQRLQDWVNSTFTPTEGGVAIPPDPIKHLHASRFRRTLASAAPAASSPPPCNTAISRRKSL